MKSYVALFPLLLTFTAFGSVAGNASEAISKTFADTFTTKAAFTGAGVKDRDFSDWNEAIDRLSREIKKVSDKDLSKGIESVSLLNRIFINALKILVNEGHDLGKFQEVYDKSGQVQKSLQKTSFFLAKKKEARDMIVEVAEYLKRAASFAQAMAQVSKNEKLGAMGLSLRSVIAEKENGNIRWLQLEDILGEDYSGVELSPTETILLDFIIAPIFVDKKTKIEKLRQVLLGAFVLVDDEGETFERIAHLEGAYLRESSHQSVAPEYSHKLPHLGAILVGVKREYSDKGKHEAEDGKKFNYVTWFQFEGSPQWKPLKKDPAQAFDAFWVEKMLGNPPAYRNTMENPVTFWDWAKHDLVDFPRYWWSGKKKNIGPFGSSSHTEKSNPLRP